MDGTMVVTRVAVLPLFKPTSPNPGIGVRGLRGPALAMVIGRFGTLGAFGTTKPAGGFTTLGTTTQGREYEPGYQPHPQLGTHTQEPKR